MNFVKIDNDLYKGKYINDEFIEEDTIIKFCNICRYYKMGDEIIKANEGINLNIYKNDFLAIVGKSGSGKSTIMNIIGTLDVATSGDYFLNGKNISHLKENKLAEIRNKTIGFIFQQYNLLPKLTVYENVELPLIYAGYSRKEREERVKSALEKVDLLSKLQNKPNQLSGGQQQRVSIARALAGSPSLILADEPTGALDSKTSREVLDLLKKLNDEGNTIILITHDNQIAKEAKRVVIIKDGKKHFDDIVEKCEL